MNVQEEALIKREKEEKRAAENTRLIAGKIPLTMGNCKIGDEILVTIKAFSVLYERAKILEIKNLGKGAIVKFITADGERDQLTARPVAAKNSKGAYQAYI